MKKLINFEFYFSFYWLGQEYNFLLLEHFILWIKILKIKLQDKYTKKNFIKNLKFFFMNVLNSNEF